MAPPRKTANILGVRREVHGGKVEVQLNGGWTAVSLMSPQAQEQARKMAGDFHWKGSSPFQVMKGETPPQEKLPEWKLPEGAPPPPPGYRPKGQPGQDGGDQGFQGNNDEGDADGDAEGDGDGEGSGPMTMEDLVDKRIKLRVDAAALSSDFHKKRDETDEFVRRSDYDTDMASVHELIEAASQMGGEGGVTVKIELRSPVEVKSQEGLFHNQYPKLVRAVSAGQHTYLPGPPGTGKSHSAEQVSVSLGWQFGSISLGPTTPESRLWGGKDANGNFQEPTFVQLARYAMDNPDSGAVFCLDEMDNGHPGIIATLNSAMANGWFTAPNNDIVRFQGNFVIVAAANTFGTGPTAEFAGRNRLDAATLDRFAYLPWDTDTALERTLVLANLAEHKDTKMGEKWLDVWHTARQNVKDHGLKVFVTMRGAINGAKLIHHGFTLREALDMVLLSKLPEDQAVKVNPL